MVLQAASEPFHLKASVAFRWAPFFPATLTATDEAIRCAWHWPWDRLVGHEVVHTSRLINIVHARLMPPTMRTFLELVGAGGEKVYAMGYWGWNHELPGELSARGYALVDVRRWLLSK